MLPYYLSYDGCHCEDDLCDADGVDGPLVEVPLVVILVGSLAVLLVYAFWLLDLLQKFTGRARSSITLTLIISSNLLITVHNQSLYQIITEFKVISQNALP